MTKSKPRSTSSQTSQQEQDRVKTILRMAMDGFYLVDMEGKILETNNSYCSMIGYSYEELLQMSVKDVEVLDRQEAIEKRIQQILGTGYARFETKHRRKDGTVIDIEASVNYLLEEQPKFFCFMRDITARKRAEEALLYFQMAVGSSTDAIGMSTPSGRHYYQNEAYTKLFGLSVSEVDGVSGPPATVYADEKVGRKVFDIIMNGGSFVGEVKMLDKDRKERDIYLRAYSIKNKEGNVLGLVGVHNDITNERLAQQKLRKSESQLRESQQIAHLGSWDLDLTIPKLEWSDETYSLFDQSPENFVPSDDIFARLVHPDDRETMQTNFNRALASDAAPYHVVVPIINESGRQWVMEALGAVRRDSEGKPLSIYGTAQDITERKRAEEEHRKLEEQLRHAQKMEAIGTLAGGVAHDFNNILNVIMGYGSLALDKMGPDNSSREEIQEVLAAANRAAVLTRRLLVFSRKQVVEVKPVDVNDIIAGVQKMLNRVIGEDIDLKIDLTDKGLTVMADAGQIEQVLMNLATNARDAMPKGGRLVITTETGQMDDAYVAAYGYGKTGAYAVIIVADTGTGMDAETQKKIFEPFFTTKGIGEGTGLGLAVSYGIVKQHYGYIKCYSEAGKGTVFKIYLPLIEDMAATGIKVEAPVGTKSGTETILVAEDDPSLRKLDKVILESAGYSVITAEDGADAVAKFMSNREKIKLVILDLVMPRKSGKAAYEEIKKMSPGIRTFFLSGYTMDMISRMEIEEGVEVLRKPVSPNDLLRKVREVLDK